MTSLDIVVPAYNEEANIRRLLDQILKQKLSVKEIFVSVISDGSTDFTNSYVKEYEGRVKLINHRKRRGKTERLLEVFKSSDSDILVLLDADISLADEYTIQNLINPILKAKSTLTSGLTIKRKKSTFVDKVMQVSDHLQTIIKVSINHGDNVYSCHGRMVALKHSTYKTVQMPVTTIGNDAYLYLHNKYNDGKFTLSNEAMCYYTAPQTIGDFAKQKNRFGNTPQELSKYFGIKVLSEYKIPLTIKLKALISSMLKYHIYFFSYLIVRYISKFFKQNNDVKWDISLSTKN